MKFDAHAHRVYRYGNHDEPVEVGTVDGVSTPPLQPFPRLSRSACFFLSNLKQIISFFTLLMLSWIANGRMQTFWTVSSFVCELLLIKWFYRARSKIISVELDTFISFASFANELNLDAVSFKGKRGKITNQKRFQSERSLGTAVRAEREVYWEFYCNLKFSWLVIISVRGWRGYKLHAQLSNVKREADSKFSKLNAA